MASYNKKYDCIVVGNSPSLVGTNLGDVIDSYKTIIRVNMCNVPALYHDTGSKTHIWATSLYERAHEKFEMSKSEIDSHIPPNVLNKEVWYRHDASKDYARTFYLDDEINYKQIIRPKGFAVTGVMAILTALQRFKNIDIVGHTLYVESGGKTKTYSKRSHQENRLIKQRNPQVRQLASFFKKGQINLLNTKESKILFGNN